MKEFAVTRERTIAKILQLCEELKKEEMLKRYRKEALSFYENLWELKQSTMEPTEMEKLLLHVKQLASSTGDHERESIYDKALQVCGTWLGLFERWITQSLG